MAKLGALEFYYDRECTRPFNATVDLGEYDIGTGAVKQVYVRNPNSIVKAVVTGEAVKTDSRTIIELPEEVLPGTVEPITFRLQAIQFSADVDEELYFQNIDDMVRFDYKWVRAAA